MPSALRHPGQTGSQTPARILIVDDAPEITRMLAIWLDPPYEAHVANDGADALTLAHHITPDVALVDIMMPAPNGFAIAEEFRRHPRLASTPVIFITGLDQPANAARAAELGVLDLLYKPLDCDTVLASVQKALELRQAH